MSKDSLSTIDINPSVETQRSRPDVKQRTRRKIKITSRSLDEILVKVNENLLKGLSAKAEKILTETHSSYNLSVENQAKIERLLSYTYEALGKYKESFEILDKYDDEDLLSKLEIDTQVVVLNQLAISLNNKNEHPKAVALLNYSLEVAKENKLTQLYGEIYVLLSRVYRKLNENPISRDNAGKGLDYYREQGDWRGMALCYYAIGGAHQHEGHSKEALENFKLAIKIIGENEAPFILGKIYSDMAASYMLTRKPQEGIDSLEKSIEFFSRTEHLLQTIAAYNNLGVNLIALGEWTKAEQMIRRALDVSSKVNHPNRSVVLDSLAELKFFRGEIKEAKELLFEAKKIAEDNKKEWFLVQVLKTIARCYLAENNFDEAIKVALENIKICEEMGEKAFSIMTRLILAEAYLKKGKIENYQKHIEIVEEDNPSEDFFVLGTVLRLKGIAALKKGNHEEAENNFSRSLTVFESAKDLYYIAISHFLIGESLSEKQPKKATKCYIAASEIFRKLGVEKLYAESEEKIELLSKSSIQDEDSSAGSHLLMQRLAEATASRELLFRELTSILQQESKATRLIIAELNEHNRFFPYITHGYTPGESSALVEKLNIASGKNELEIFAKTKNVTVFPLKTSNAQPAMLIMFPASGAKLQNGADIKPLLRVVELGMDVCALRDRDKFQQTEQEASPFTSQSLMPGFIHSSTAMTELVEEVYKISSSDVTVLVTGESGTGKELVSRAIHTISNRKDKIFIPFNCTTVPKELAEGHLFGYKKGAYTGAAQDSPGVIRSADQGTLFLDEVGDLPLDVQPKLLRFLQEGEVQPLGAKAPIKVDVRIITATNMDLEDQVQKGLFREDLFYRLNVIRLRVPPLRERRSEIEPIVSYYLNHYSSRFDKRDIKITPQTIDMLMVCEWDGNVRQLCNEVQRIVARATDGEIITPDHLSPELKRNAKPLTPIEGSNVKPIMSNSGSAGNYNIGANGSTLEEAVAELERQMIIDTLRRHEGNISQVARELDITRRGLYLKIKRYEIDRDKAVA